jgi:hypothetical protein
MGTMHSPRCEARTGHRDPAERRLARCSRAARSRQEGQALRAAQSLKLVFLSRAMLAPCGGDWVFSLRRRMLCARSRDTAWDGAGSGLAAGVIHPIWSWLVRVSIARSQPRRVCHFHPLRRIRSCKHKEPVCGAFCARDRNVNGLARMFGSLPPSGRHAFARRAAMRILVRYAPLASFDGWRREA